MLYFKKCWQGVLFKGGKFNGGAYNYIYNSILNYFGASDLYMFYSYLLHMKPKQITIFDLLKEARAFTEQEKVNAEKAKIKAQKIEDYDDLLGELL